MLGVCVWVLGGKCVGGGKSVAAAAAAADHPFSALWISSCLGHFHPPCPAGLQVQRTPLTYYAVQLLLNFMWTPIFFSLHRVDWALAEILGGWWWGGNMMHVEVYVCVWGGRGGV